MPIINMAIAVADGELAFIPDHPKRFPLTGRHRYFRLDDYKSHWRRCHKDQEWVNQTRDRFTYLWQEFCEQRDKRPIFTTPAPCLAFPQATSMDVAPPFALRPPDADTPTVPMRPAQAPAQMTLVENSFGLFGQDLFASTTPLLAVTVPILIHPASAYNYPAASVSSPSAFDYTHYPRYTPIDTTFSSRSSSASTSRVPSPPAGDVFTSGGASHQLQSCLEPFGAFDPGLCPSQADNQDWGKWLADI